MTSWQATNAKAKFSAVLDAAETEGPQLIQRRTKRFLLMTEEESERLIENARASKTHEFVSAWDALKPSSGKAFDVDFPRLRSKARVAKF